ncbi:hypothetical protein K431DRAFT_331398 [Polychaeton citri CBS 116435]|uniref:Uncharacterized protein n=1 Tax=Polychaeton citri CBS 116435 TaxID=1314669 RepID=A0A9P4QCX7_9PEZI|nr:hypothetical protein K431DRAFT_331398 [Polychaeton citri CBS 116435]
MTERVGRYFWTSVFAFSDDARQDILGRATQHHPDLSVTYNNEDAMFELACPNIRGPEVDESFAALAANYIIEELRRAAQHDREPKVERYPEGKINTIVAQGEMPRSLSSLHPQIATHNTITTIIINNESRDIDIGIIKLSGVPDPVRRRLLSNNNPRIFSLARAVKRNAGFTSDLMHSPYTGPALSYNHELKHLLFHPVKPIGMVVTVQRLPDSESQVQTWEHDGFKPMVRQWLAGMGKTKLVDPNEKREMPVETARMIQVPLSQPIVGRPRVARVARVPIDDTSDSESDSSTTSGESMESKSPPPFSRPLMSGDKSGSSLPFRRGIEQSHTEDPVDPTIRRNKKANALPVSSARCEAIVPPGHHFSTSLTPEDANTSDPRIQIDQMHQSASRTLGSCSTALGTFDRFPAWSQYTNVDKYGLTGHPSKQADWEYQSNIGSSSIRSLRYPASVPFTSDKGHAPMPPQRGPFSWENKISYSPMVPSGMLVDISEENPAPGRSFPSPASRPSSSSAQPMHQQGNKPNSISHLTLYIDPQRVKDQDNPIEERLLTLDENEFPRLHDTMRQKARGKTKNRKGRKSERLHGSSKMSQIKPLLELPDPPPPPREAREQPRHESNVILRNTSKTGDGYLDALLLQQTASILQNCRFPAAANIHFGVALLQDNANQDRVLSLQRAQTKLSASRDACDFVKRLTSSDSDIGAVVGQILKQTDTEVQSSIYYDIHLQDVNKLLYILRVDPDDPSQYSAIRKVPPYGTVTIFNVLRTHDMRLEIVEAGDLDPRLPKTILDVIVGSLECNGDATEIKGKLTPEIAAVPAVQYRHSLRLTHMEFTYIVDYMLDPGRTLSAKRLDDKSMRLNHRLWWEIKLDAERQITDQNSGTDVCRRLFTEAMEITKFLDGVGQNNEGPLKEYAADMSRLKDMQREAEKAAMPKFW